MTDTPHARTNVEMAQYVREHQCWNADPNVTIGDWHRGILAIEAEARATRPPEQHRFATCPHCDEQLLVASPSAALDVERLAEVRLARRLAPPGDTTDAETER